MARTDDALWRGLYARYPALHDFLHQGQGIAISPRQEAGGKGMTPDEFQQVVEALDVAIGRRMEQVYATVEELRGDVATAVQQVADTARVLYDNDTAIMGEMARVRGDEPTQFTEQVAGSWRRFVIAEAKALGLKIVVPKGEVAGDG